MAASLCGCAPAASGNAAGAPAPIAAIPRSSPPPVGTPADPVHRYVDSAWGFGIDAQAGWTLHHDFTHGYLANGAWKTFARPDSTGTPVLALTLPGSNHVTAGAIRIGASQSPEAIRGCTAPPGTVRPGTLGTHAIGGTRFTTFMAADAAMSHYLDVRSYRVVHGSTCYAIDLLVFGTNPQVYSPPATPPFTRAQAFARMQKVVASFRFTR